MAVLLGILILAVKIYWWLILGEVILSWIPRRPGEPAALTGVRDFLALVTGPYLGIFRRLIPPVGVGGVGLDFSPLIGLIILSVVERFLTRAGYAAGALVLP